MYAPERHQAILETARAAGRVEVTALAEALDVTAETIRRDLTALERHGLVRRVHGGAIPVERLGTELAVGERQGVFSAEKERIAKTAVAELPDGGTVVVDAGTTTARLAELLPTDRDLVVVTHGLQVAQALATRPNVTLHLVGGQVRPRTLAAVGSWAERALAEVFADVCFLGTNGLSVERGLTTPDLAEAGVKRALMRAARRTVVLADHSKLGRDDFAHVADLEGVDTVITDSGADPDVVADVEAAGPRVVRA
ncbi:DeoR/GlpR family DNA-binding transcription regulator [Kineococcus sp. SYSU DK005]|uniref:DeoR/GlpR family DNA-binding transcription regulator n=1 Tax=Kineococcus sp. SYSU DK005 TaxID=3383126 RepID=UPI003D7CC2EF